MKYPNGLEFNLREGSYDGHVIMDEIDRDIYEVGYPKVAVDIGAHIGGTTIVCAKRGAEVYAYEPSLANYMTLLKNIGLNRVYVNAFNLGVGRQGKRKLYLNNCNYGCFSVNRDNTSNGMIDNYEMIDVIGIEQVFNKIEHCDFLKIDCEGAEVEFIKDLPVEKIDRISVEFHGRPEDKECIEFLSKYYSVFRKQEHLYICQKLVL